MRWQAENDLVVNVVAAAILGLLVGLTLRLAASIDAWSRLLWSPHHLQQLDGCLRRDDPKAGDWSPALGLIGLTLGLGAATIVFLIGQQIKPSALGR